MAGGTYTGARLPPPQKDSIRQQFDPRLGGKSIKPAQPAGTWEINEMSGYNYLTHGGSDDAQRLRYAWRTALSRSPSESESAILGKTLATQLATYAADKPAAALVKVGDLEKSPGLDDSQLAAWTAVANVLLNLNETISDYPRALKSKATVEKFAMAGCHRQRSERARSPELTTDFQRQNPKGSWYQRR